MLQKMTGREKTSKGADERRRRLSFPTLVMMFTLGLFLVAGCSSGSDSSGDTDDSGGTNNSGSSGSGEKTGVYEQDGAEVASATETGMTYAATGEDESAVYVYGGGTYTLSDSTLTKTGDTSSADDSNFYGNNAIVLAEDESTITLTGCTLTADSEGSNGAFAYGEGSYVYLDNCTITTTGDSARGVDATYGGTVDVRNSTISTQGAHCAALATDRYENNEPPAIDAYNVTGTTAGDGSPGIYCTGTFTVEACDLTATGSEAAAIEGLNSITLTDSDIEGQKKWGVIIYQSTSGDSTEGNGIFDMSGGSLTNTSSGPVFMVCNTEATIVLEDVIIDTGGDVLIRATDSSSGDANINTDWGSAGGDVTFSATDQALEGTVSINDLSSLDMTLSGSSTLSGAVDDGDSNDGEVNITLEGTSTWTATGDSYVDALNGSSLPGAIDAATGVTIYYESSDTLSGNYSLSSGGLLQQL
jgi:hypothetical protein